MKNLLSTLLLFVFLLLSSGIMVAQEVSLDVVESSGGCGLATDCETDFICFDVRMTVDTDKDLDSYNIWLQYDQSIISRINGGDDNSCVIDNGGDTNIEALTGAYRVAGIPGSAFPMIANVQEVVHTICFSILDANAIDGSTLSVGGSLFNGALPTSITFSDGSTDAVNEVTPLQISATTLSCLIQPPVATYNESLANVAGNVSQEVILEDDGDGVDSDPDGSINTASIDLDPTTEAIEKSFFVVDEGTWTEDGAGNVTFAPISVFTNDPTPILYTISDNDDNKSNADTILVDYVPVATDDLSDGNTTNTNVTVDVVANDTDGDLVDPTTVTLELTGLPMDASCTATDAQGDCIEVTIPGQGVYSVNETTGAITFDPADGFTADPSPITYTVEDNEGNPDSAILTIEFDKQPPVATDNESLANVAGDVTQQVVTEDDGDGVDNDPDGSLTLASVDLDPATMGIQSSLLVATQGTWSVDGAGNVTFAPISGFTNDPTPINYTINDNDANTSNTAEIIVDYVPVATDDLSDGNTTNTNVTVDVLANDNGGDLVDPTTVTLELTGLPMDASCTATDAQGDCIEVTIPGQGVYSVNETTGAITFDPADGFTADPSPITYTVEDNEGNPDSAILTIEFDKQPPVATDNESLANVAGDVTQQVVTEDDGDGVDNDPDGSLTLASVDLDPATMGIQSSLLVATQGTWSVDGAGNVTFAPISGFTNDPTPINYTINDNDANTSNVAMIAVDYVPVATNDQSDGNTTNTNVTVDIVANDTDGDLVDATTVSLELTGLPMDASCTATDAQGDCIEVTVPSQGVYSVNETSGAITFDPADGFTADPDPITYTVEDDEGNSDSAILTIEFDKQPPVATDNESLANTAGDVTQQVVTEDDGDGVDNDPDGSLTLASVDLDPATMGIQSSLLVATQGTWSVDGAGNVTFAPISGFTNDPTPINYTINDNDANTSNLALITVDYVPVAVDDLSDGNTTNTNVTVDVAANDTDGDLVDGSTVSLELTGLPMDATCTDTDFLGDCIEVTIPGQGVYSVNETSGAITFDPADGFTSNPTPITYAVEDNEGNPTSAVLTIEFDARPPVATDNESLANVAGDVTQQVVTEDDGDGVDNDPDGLLTLASVDLDPTAMGIQSSLAVATQGTWSVDGAGNVTFAPISGFTNDPTPINYTINDNDGNTSNIAEIVVDYVPVATDDLSDGNTTNTNVTVDVLSNDTNGDLVDVTTVSLELTGLPMDATCTAIDAQGKCIQVTITGQGVYSVNETSGAITFDPADGFTADPSPITYTVEDNEGNPTSAVLTIEFDARPPVATDNESLANVAGDVTQQVVTEDDGDGLDSDPDGSLTLASVDLDPSNMGIQSSLVVITQGAWTVDGAGNVTFAPFAGFKNDPSPIEYTINDNDGNTSNIATIIVDYVPVANDDLSDGNTTNTNVTVDVVANDTDGDEADATTVTLELTGLPMDATCSDTDADGDCIEVTILGQGVYSVNETSGAITFDPADGFTADPSPITYTVEDNEGNPTSAVLTVEFEAQLPIATDNESLANVAGDVTQQVVTEDDGDGLDNDPDGSLSLASVDLDPSAMGIQTSFVVATEGAWTVDGAGNVTFAPFAAFTIDPTPIEYTINDNDGNTSNIATITVDYVPVANDDLSSGNIPTTNVTVDAIANDTDGDEADATTVTLELTGLPMDATCTGTDADGDCIEMTVPNQGVYSVNETSGAITFDPTAGFSADPDPITYTVEDHEGNPSSALVTIDYLNTTSAEDDINQTTVNVAVGGNVLTNDIDPQGDVLTITLIDSDKDGLPDVAPTPGTPQDIGDGTLDINPTTGNYTFTPNPEFVGTVEIEYTVCDDGTPIACASATLVIDVSGPGPEGGYPPIALDDNATTEQDTDVDILILGNDSDIDGNIVPSSVSLDASSPGLPLGTSCSMTDIDGDCTQVTVPGEGVYTLNEVTGVVTFDPDATFTGSTIPLTYTVCDDNTPTRLCAEAEITVTISDPSVNEMTAEDDANAGFAGETLTGNVLTNDIDPDGSTGIPTINSPMADTDGDGILDAIMLETPTMIYGIDSDNPGTYKEAGTLTIGADGTYTYESHLDFAGTIYIPYTACDNDVMNACDDATLYLTTAPFCTVIDIRVLLEGPYQEGSLDMTTYLNEYHLLPGQQPAESSNFGSQLFGIAAPSGQPYNEAPWNYAGAEGDSYGDGVGRIPYPSTVTDWILVSIRENFNSTTPIWQCAALLNNNGSVTFPDDCPCLETVSTEDYYIVVEHRNHLSVMSQPVTPLNGVITFDFTSTDSWKLNIGSPQEVTQKSIDGKFVMYAGNSDQTGGRTDMNSFDNSIWIQDNGNIFQYLKGDHLLDADVNSFDRAIWIINNGQFQLISY